jgi:hypothetical protein
MEHIHNLVIIDVVFRSGDAYVSTNTVHNALFARTCMMSRTAYKGCKVEFFRDECDVPLPAPTHKAKAVAATSAKPKAKAAIANRFNLLNIDDDHSSDEEDKVSIDDVDTAGVGLSLKYLELEGIA